MKTFFLLAVVFMVTNTFGQTLFDFGRQNAPSVPGVTLNSMDTTLRILYVEKANDQKSPAFYLNGRLVNQTFFNTLDAKLIDSIKVDKDSFQIGNLKYYGQIHIKTKNSYNAKIISLAELKEKYTNLKREPAIFMVDGEIITSDYDEYMVDENLLWRIFIDKVKNEKENIDLKFIKLLTKSEENLKKPAEIRIRGTEVGLTK